MTPCFSKGLRIIFLLSVGLTILPFLIVAFYTHPQADDYVFSNTLTAKGYWGSQWEWYQRWTGRCTFMLIFLKIRNIG